MWRQSRRSGFGWGREFRFLGCARNDMGDEARCNPLQFVIEWRKRTLIRILGEVA